MSETGEKPTGTTKAGPERQDNVPPAESKQEAELDEALEETFPASDPIAPFAE